MSAVPAGTAPSCPAARPSDAAPRTRLAAALFVLAAGAVAARAEGEFALQPGEKVTAAFISTGESRTGGIAGLAGARLSVTAKAKKPGAARPTLSLRRPGGGPVDLGRSYRYGGTSASFRNVPLADTGVHRLVVTTPANYGGVVEVSASAKLPAFGTRSATSAGGTGTLTFDALAGTRLDTLTVTCATKPKWTPAVEILAPDGTSVAYAAGKKSRALLRKVALPSLGTYTVVVRGGDGAFRVSARARPPAPRKLLAWSDIVPPPAVTSFAPWQVDDDSAVQFTLGGTGFLLSDRLHLVQEGTVRHNAAVAGATPEGAWVLTDLDPLAPGSYEVDVVTREGTRTRVPGTLLVSNRAPGLTTMNPPFVPWGASVPATVEGFGFDANAAVQIVRSGDQSPLPVTIAFRAGSKRIGVTVATGSYVTGPCDVIVSEGATTVRRFPLALDIVGWTAPPRDLASYAGTDASSSVWVGGAAFDDATGRVCAGLRLGSSVRFVLFDPATMTIESEVSIPSAGGAAPTFPEVAFDPRDRLWALTWTLTGSPRTANVRLVAASDLTATVAQHELAAAWSVGYANAAADPARGGFLLVWDTVGGTAGPGHIFARRISPDGALQGDAPTIVDTDPGLWVWGASVLPLSGGRFVICYGGLSAERDALGVRAAITDADARVVREPFVCTSNPAWNQLWAPKGAVNPEDGSVMLTFTYDDGDSAQPVHPATVLLTGADLGTAALTTHDDDGIIPFGVADDVAWHPARREFVLVCTVPPAADLIRRIAPDGRIKPGPVPQPIDGIWGRLWSGAAPGTLGLLRTYDGTEDGSWNPGNLMYVSGGPMR